MHLVNEWFPEADHQFWPFFQGLIQYFRMDWWRKVKVAFGHAAKKYPVKSLQQCQDSGNSQSPIYRGFQHSHHKFTLCRGVFTPKIMLCTLKNEEAFYMLLYIEDTKLRKNSKCTSSFKMQWECWVLLTTSPLILHQWFLARLNNVQEELLCFCRRWHRRLQMLKFYIKVFRTSLFPNPVMDLIHVLYSDRYWSKIFGVPSPLLYMTLRSGSQA